MSCVFRFMWTHYDTSHVHRAGQREFERKCCNKNVATCSISMHLIADEMVSDIVNGQRLIADFMMGTKRGENETERVREDGKEGAKGNKKKKKKETEE